MKFRMLALGVTIAFTGMSAHAHTVCTAVADAASGKMLMQQGLFVADHARIDL